MDTEKMYGHIVRTPGTCGGKPRIDGLRLPVQAVAIAFEHQDMTPDEICDAYPPVTLGQVHAALAYYYDHRAEIEAEIQEEIRFAEEFRQQHPEWVR